jgi:hypothetical protein
VPSNCMRSRLAGTTPRDLYQATVLRNRSTMTSGGPEHSRMTPNRQSPAYALFARRRIVPQPPDVLAANPPASQEPLSPSGTEGECRLPAPAVAAASAPIVKRPRQKAAAAAKAESQSVPIPQSPLQIDPSTAVRRADILCLTGVQHRPVEWLWQERLASGTLAMLSADVGAGKTLIALAIAAALSRGRAPFSGSQYMIELDAQRDGVSIATLRRSKFDIGVISAKDGVSGSMVLVSAAGGSKSEGNISTAHGGVARKF